MKPLMRPSDSTEKFVYHSFIASPDMLNVQQGNVVTDHHGYAYVELPRHFQAQNRDFRYQLTVIGQFAQVIVLRKVHNQLFVIKTDKAGVEVSWQVTGVRHDASAEVRRMNVAKSPARVA